jgi:MFS family permease
MNPVVRRVLFGNALAAIGSGLTLPLLIVYLGQVRGLGTAVGGFVVAYIALLQLILLPLTGILVDRLGPRPALMGGLLVQGAGVALLTQVESIASAYAVATVISIGSAFSWGPQSALLGRLTTPEERTRVFGIQFMLLNLGIGIGGVIAATVVVVDQPATFEVLYLADSVTYLLYFLVLATLRGVGVGRAPVDGDGAEAEGGYREVLRDRRLLRVVALGLVLMTCGYGSLEVGLPIIITVVNGLSVSWVAIAFAVNTATIVIVQLFSLKVITGRSRSRLLAVVAGLWAVSWVMLGLSGALPVTFAVVAICLSTAVFALGETLSAPIMPSLVNDLAPAHLRGRYNAMQSITWGVSGALGPAIAGVMLGAGLEAAWIALVVGGLVLAGVLALRLRRTLTPALDGRAPDVADARVEQCSA